MTLENYGYDIDVKEIVPPIGGVYKFAAKVEVITENVNYTVKYHHPELGETHGKTKEEAREKMDELVTKWILKRIRP